MKRWRRSLWRPSVVAGALVVANLATYVLQAAQGPAGQEWVWRYGLLPAVLLDGRGYAIHGSPTPYALTLVTSSFLHGDLGHLAVNLAFIAVLGTMVERAIGSWRFGVVWAAAVAVGGTFHAVLNSASLIPTIGASAGVAGLIGVVTVGGWAGLLAGGLWLSVQLIGALTQPTALLGSNIAWQAHLAGFATGIMGGLLVRWELRRRRRRGADAAIESRLTAGRHVDRDPLGGMNG